jgi:hypothetical protein
MFLYRWDVIPIPDWHQYAEGPENGNGLIYVLDYELKQVLEKLGTVAVPRPNIFLPVFGKRLVSFGQL